MNRGKGRRPVKFRVLQGNGHGSRAFDDGNPEFKPAVMMPAPTWLGDEGRKMWNDSYASLAEQGMVTSVNWFAFAMLCDMWGEFVQARIEKKKVSHGERAELRRCASEFGLTPNSQGGVAGPKKLEKPSRFAEFMSGQKK